MAIHGYMGKVLYVDLTKSTYEEIVLDQSIYREYIGGYGLGIRFIYEKMKAQVDPLGPENILGFVAGTLVGTKSHGGGRFSVVAKSPLTNGWGDSNCGGNFGPKLRSTGYDGIFITGKSDKPVYLWITDQTIEFRDASHLWGKDSSETEDIIKNELGIGVSIASIGQAGEGLSKISGIMHDRGRAAGRLGLGAVMGSKKLKAIAVTGSQKIPVANETGFAEVFNQMREEFSNKTRLINALGNLGTSSVFARAVAIQDAPVQNWKGIAKDVYPMEMATKLTGDNYAKYVKKKYACAQCALGCGAILEVTDPDGNRFETHRPEYETISAFGSMCLVDDIETILFANELCNRYGFDTISAGATIAFAMECYEKGILTLQDTNGIPLEWGNKAAIIPMIELMAKREGIGGILADGVKSAAEKIGKGSAEYAIHIGGQEPAMHDPRCWSTFAYSYVMDATPGRHTHSGIGFIEHGWSDKNLDPYKIAELMQDTSDYETMGKVKAILKHWFNFVNATGLCLFVEFGYNYYPLIEAVKTITGWEDFDISEAITAGERINTLRHCFNLREGSIKNNFELPARLTGLNPADGPGAKVPIDMEAVRKSNFAELDWDLTTGKPSNTKLESLNLSSLITDL